MASFLQTESQHSLQQLLSAMDAKLTPTRRVITTEVAPTAVAETKAEEVQPVQLGKAILQLLLETSGECSGPAVVLDWWLSSYKSTGGVFERVQEACNKFDMHHAEIVKMGTLLQYDHTAEPRRRDLFLR